MTAKILQFRPRPIRLTKEVLLPGLVTYDYEDPLAALETARAHWLSGRITKRMLTWLTDQILERIIKSEPKDAG